MWTEKTIHIHYQQCLDLLAFSSMYYVRYILHSYNFISNIKFGLRCYLMFGEELY